MNAALPILATLIALPVLFRVGRLVTHMSRRHFADPWRFQGFALGYALLGALTVQLLIDAWSGRPIDVSDVGFIAASALLIIFDRRGRP